MAIGMLGNLRSLKPEDSRRYLSAVVRMCKECVDCGPQDPTGGAMLVGIMIVWRFGPVLNEKLGSILALQGRTRGDAH